MNGIFGSEQRNWLVQCKHFAHSGRSVGVTDIDNIIDSCSQHNATGYLLACSTQPSSGVVDRLEAISQNAQIHITAAYWDGVHIERTLSTPKLWSIAQKFLPKSSGDWKIFATDRPNDFVAHYRGYVIHLSNRIGSIAYSHSLESIEARIVDIEKVEMPKGHVIRPRSVWYDDKNGGYTWYIDYMYPSDEKPVYRKSDIKNILGDGWALDDGQVYSFDVSIVMYYAFSDHHDENHYDFYTKYLPNYLIGSPRPSEGGLREYYATKQEIEDLEEDQRSLKDPAFEELVDALSRLPFITVLNSWNSQPEEIHRFSRRRVWSDIMKDINWKKGNFFDVQFRLRVKDINELDKLAKSLPQEYGASFELSRALVYLPGGKRLDDDEIYNLELSVSPVACENERDSRSAMNSYLAEITKKVRSYKSGRAQQ